MGPVVLSERLRAVASMVAPGVRVCDVGCDHGFVSIWLVECRRTSGSSQKACNGAWFAIPDRDEIVRWFT